MEEEANVDNNEVEVAEDDKLRQIFALFDRDHSGFVDPEEMAAGLRALGCNPTATEIEDMIKDANEKVDSETGKLDFAAFSEIISKYQKNTEEVESELLKAFMYFDKNGDGSVDKEELREALKSNGFDKLTDDEVDELFAEADADDNGRINYQELVSVICKNS
jgi:Ca2+-binding EF-hand superfamily protein